MCWIILSSSYFWICCKIRDFFIPGKCFHRFFPLKRENVKEYLILITFRNRKGCGFCIVRSISCSMLLNCPSRALAASGEVSNAFFSRRPLRLCHWASVWCVRVLCILRWSPAWVLRLRPVWTVPGRAWRLAAYAVLSLRMPRPSTGFASLLYYNR